MEVVVTGEPVFGAPGVAGLIEGMSMHIDNLMCPMVFYSGLVQLHAIVLSVS